MAATGCADQSVGPDGLREAQLSLAASFPASASQQARAVDGFRVAVSRPGQGVVAEASGTLGPEESSVTVVLTVQLEAPCESLLVLIELSSSGEIWYRAERDLQVCAGRGNEVPTLQLQWVGPLIGLSPAQLSFNTDQATNPSSQTFTVTNTGGGTLNWTASGDANWLAVSPATGTLGPGASQTVTATVTSATLNPGQFQANVGVTDSNAANSPQSLPVSLTVIEVTNSVIRGTVSVEGDGLSGVSVTLAGKESRSTTTDASGRFEVTGLTSGGYTVTIGDLPVGVSFPSNTQSVSLGVNETRALDFQGTYIRTSSVAGTVTADGAGLAGVTVTLSGTEFRSTTTGEAGVYSFTGLRAGTYAVAISGFPEGVSFQVTSRNASVGVDQQVVLDFAGSVIRNSSISGTVTVEGSPLAGVTVTLGGVQTGSVATDASGQYAFTGLRDGEYTVEISGFSPQVTFLDTPRSVTLGVNEEAVVDFSGTVIGNSSISGRVFMEGSPLAMVTVTLSGPQSGSAVSDEAGRFSFAGLRDGAYTVSVSNYPSDIAFADSIQEVSLGVNDDRTINFQGSYIRTSSIVGTVTAGDMGLGGVTVSLSGTETRSTTTNSSGNYQFTEIRRGSYTVAISNLPAGSVFSTTSRNVTVALGETVQVDFSGTIVVAPSPEYSYIEACPAVIPRAEEVGWSAAITVGVRDQFSHPIQGATVLLSESPQLAECSPSPPLESSFLITGPNGLAFTGYNSCWGYSGPMTFTAQITANSSTITLQESDDLYVDVQRWGYWLERSAGNGQTIQAGQSGTFSVRVFSQSEAPAPGIPVGWEVEGGNCLYSFTDGSGVAAISLNVPPSITPGTYRVTANIADIDWGSEPWELVNVVFTYNVMASSQAPSGVAAPGETSRLRGTPLQPMERD